MSRRLITIAAIMASSMWAPLFVVPPIDDILINALGLSHLQTSILFSGPILMLCLAAIPAGNLADRVGIKRIAGIGSIIIVIGAVMRGFAHDFTFLLIATLVYGLGIGCTFPNLPKLVRHCTPREQALFYIGVLVSAVLLAGGIALSITLPVIYPLTHTYSGVFFIWSIPSFIAMVLWWVFITEPPCEVPRSMIKGPIPAPKGIRPVLKNRNMWLISMTFFLHLFFLYTWTLILPGFFLYKGSSTTLSGVIPSMMFWVGIPTVIIIPWFTMKLNIQRKLFVWIPSLALIFCSWAIMDVSLFLSWFLMVLAGIATTLRFITILTMPVEVMPPEQAGTVSGVNISIAYTGALVGPLVAGVILNSGQNYNTIYWILVAVSAATVVMGLLLPYIEFKQE
jgi:MFS transporter, CP family, cyanate transporter